MNPNTKWNREVLDTFPENGGEFDTNKTLTILERINRLLRRAMLGTDDPQLNNDIARELQDDE